MTPNKTKSGLFETPRIKASPTTPRVTKLGRAPAKSEPGPHSPLQSSRLSVDRSPLHNSHLSVDRSPGSPRSVDSRSSVDRRSPRISTPIAKVTRSTKGSELQAELNVAQEDLKRAKEQLASLEKEKARALEELKEAKRRADVANEKLTEALVARKQAEECTEIERFRAIELEQTSIEASQQKGEAWQKELENVRSQHAADVSALLSTTEELERVKQELAMTMEAKNAATVHADEALSIAEVNAEKVVVLSQEVSHLKALLDSKLESKDSETAEQVKKLDSEIDALRHELERAKEAEKKVVEMETLIEDLKKEITDVKKAELDAGKLVDEWKRKAELLEVKVEEAVLSERSASESLASAMKQLEECNASLKDAESEVMCLKGKVESLEMEILRHTEDVQESDHQLEMAKKEVLELGKTVEVLKSELRSVEEEKTQALDNGKKTTSNTEILLEEKNRLLVELEASKDEVEKSKIAMDGLASALHEVSTEAREAHGKMLTKQSEFDDAKDKIGELKVTLKTSEEKYEAMLSEAKDEITLLKATVKGSKMEAENSMSERKTKEQNFVSSLKKSEEELAVIKEEMDKAVSKLKGAESEAAAAKQEEAQLLNRLRQAKMEAATANEAAEEAMTEKLRMKERLLDKENELQSITQENDDLRTREEAALKKIKELYLLLEEARSKKSAENGELSNSEKDYDIVSKTIEFPNASAGEFEPEKNKSEMTQEQHEDLGREDSKPREVNGNGIGEKEEPAGSKNWESCKFVDKGLSPESEHEPESVGDEAGSKVESESFDQRNGLSSDKMESMDTSPSKEHQLKKKTPLLRKFGNLLKKKNNHK